MSSMDRRIDMARSIAVIGTGHVGLVSAVGLADFGNKVVGVDLREDVVDHLNNGIPTIYEHDIDDYLSRNLRAGRLHFTQNITEAVAGSEVVLLAVGTPMNAAGAADLSQLEAAIESISSSLTGFKVIVTKSTVPVGTNKWIKQTLVEQNSGCEFTVISNPEFLREGRAIHDFFHPDRVVLGYECDGELAARGRSIIEEIYRPLYLLQTPFVWCGLETAELAKYASNAFLATKITFVNQMANLAEACGADIQQVAQSMGMDGRIGPKFLHPGPGYGGSCFPKDTRALVATGDAYSVDMSLLKEVIRSNELQKQRVVQKLTRLLGVLKGRTIAVLGLSFKAETDDVRESASIVIVEHIVAKGGIVRAHDPKAMENFKAVVGDKVNYTSSALEAADGADCLLILAEWNEYRNLDLEKIGRLMKGNIVYDTRNVLRKKEVEDNGLIYAGTGR